MFCFFFKRTSISDYIHIYDSDLLLATLTTLFRKTTLKMHSLETTLTMLIYIKNSFITDYADNDDIQNYVKNNFIIDYAGYTDLQDYIKNNFINDYADYADLQDYIDSADYADISTTLTTLIY